MVRPFAGLATGLQVALAGVAAGQDCQVTTLQDSTPTSGNVVLQSFSYCGGTLNATAYITNLAYNKVVTIYYTNVAGQSTPLSAAELNYVSSVADTNYELWTTSTPAWIEGIQKLLNVTYQVTDLGQTYDQILNRAVDPSGAPAPTLPSPPAPYATPKGFGDDISEFLAAANGSELEKAYTGMFENINPAVPGAAKGVVVAGRSGPSFPSKVTDYEYDWVRDSSLTMDVVQMLYAAATDEGPKQQYEDSLFEYAMGRAVEQTDPNLQTGLGEPKFYLNNTVYSGPWGRPQNDGPATAAITLMQFAKSYLGAGGDPTTVVQKLYDSTNYPKVAPVQKDLLFVARNWSSLTYDLWEEEYSTFFYDRMVQRRALVMGVEFAESMNDSSTASTLKSAADALTPTLNEFWDEGRQILIYQYGPVIDGRTSYLDSSVILALIHGYAGDGVYGWSNDRVQSTVVRMATKFATIYPIFNETVRTASPPLGIPIGRYPEDRYNGTGTENNGGNPWYLTTAAFAQYMYALSAEYTSAGSIAPTNTSLPFFNYFTPDAGVAAGQTYPSGCDEFSAVIDGLNGWGDAFLRTIKHYTPADGTLTEEIDRNTGAPQGCADLTWSYASVLTAGFQRARTRQEKTLVQDLANLGFTENS